MTCNVCVREIERMCVCVCVCAYAEGRKLTAAVSGRKASCSAVMAVYKKRLYFVHWLYECPIL